MNFATQTRRDVLKAGSLAALAAVLAPQMGMAQASLLETELKKLYGDKKMAEGKINFDLPQIAENGLVVPVGVTIDSPMSAGDFVKAVHIFADGNPLPGVVSYKFAPEAGRASANTRMRLAKTQNIICVAEMSNGALFSAKQEVKVTIGGCGG
ncbi:MAG: thiosulfate oxidation carrier protein SoxY [Alphaproteobacteria bacterium]|nr:thiosulfate oxidation carrier protein SoxY [Alphaproteobacteria bacterium]